MPEKLYTTAEVAGMFKVTNWTARQWITNGLLRAFKLPNGRWRITQSALEEFVEQKGQR